MKLGISYNLFDGEELLEASLKSVRPEADYINIIYQTESYYGNKAKPDITEYLTSLKNKGLIDEIYLYQKNFQLEKYKVILEQEKRNIGLKLCKKRGMSHFLSMDVDEFYDTEQLKAAKKYIEKKKIQTSAVSILEYLKSPEYKILNGYTFEPKSPYNFYVPFIMKINKFTKQKHTNKWYPCWVDPSRALNNKKKFYLFSVQDILMHHMSTIRKDLQKKYSNSNFNLGDENTLKQINDIKKAILNWNFEENQIQGTQYAIFRNKIIEKVENRFNIHI